MDFIAICEMGAKKLTMEDLSNSYIDVKVPLEQQLESPKRLSRYGSLRKMVSLISFKSILSSTSSFKQEPNRTADVKVNDPLNLEKDPFSGQDVSFVESEGLDDDPFEFSFDGYKLSNQISRQNHAGNSSQGCNAKENIDQNLKEHFLDNENSLGDITEIETLESRHNYPNIDMGKIHENTVPFPHYDVNAHYLKKKKRSKLIHKLASRGKLPQVAKIPSNPLYSLFKRKPFEVVPENSENKSSSSKEPSPNNSIRNTHTLTVRLSRTYRSIFGPKVSVGPPAIETIFSLNNPQRMPATQIQRDYPYALYQSQGICQGLFDE